MRVARQRFDWTKDRLEYLVTNAPTTSPVIMARELGCSSETIYNKLVALGMNGIRKRVVTAEELEKRSVDQKERVAREKSNRWPQIVTTMAVALAGRLFDDNVDERTSANPLRVRTRWVGDIGEAKSSMGNG